jgi:hypothetical protein
MKRLEEEVAAAKAQLEYVTHRATFTGHALTF